MPQQQNEPMEPVATNAPIGDSYDADFKAAGVKADKHFGIKPEEKEPEEADEPKKTEETEEVKGDDDEEKAPDTEDDSATPDDKPSDDDDAKPDDESSDDTSDLKALRTLAKKHGFEIDKGQRKVSIPERTAWRQKMSEDRAKMRQEAERYSAELKQRGDGLSQKFEKGVALQKAVEADDVDAMAKVFGYASYRDMNKNYANSLNSPQHRQIEALKSREAERDKRDATARESMRQEQEFRAQEVAQTEWLEELGDHLLASKDSVVSALSKEQDFRVYVDQVLKEHDGKLSVDEASGMVLKKLRGERDRLNRYLGDATQLPADEDIVETPVNGASAETKPGQRKKPPKVISQKEAADASVTGANEDLDEAAYRRKWIKRMEESARG